MRDHKTAAVLLAAFIAGWGYGEGASSEATSESQIFAIPHEELAFVPTEHAAPDAAKAGEWTLIVLSADGEGEVQGEDGRPLAPIWFAPVQELP